jgi:hypothetical protein
MPSTLLALTGLTTLLARSGIAEKVKVRVGLDKFQFPYCGMCIGFWVGVGYNAVLLEGSLRGSFLLGFSVSLTSYLVSVTANALETYSSRG